MAQVTIIFSPHSLAIKVLNSLATHPKSFIRERLTALCFHIFGSVHAMKTEIPPFDSELKDLTNSSL